MAFEVVSWNIRGGFSQEDTGRQIIDRVIDLKPDAAIFPEAYIEGEERHLDTVQEKFETAGYQVTHTHYDDEERLDRVGMLGIVSKNVYTPDRPAQIIRLAGRNAIMQWLVDPETDIETTFVGVHLNDRNEAARLDQVRELLPLIPAYEHHVIAGDMNAVHWRDSNSSAMYGARFINRLVQKGILPITEPTGIKESFSVGKLGSLGQRLAEMGEGKTMCLFEEAGYQDIDHAHQPTMPARFPLAQLDYILISRYIRAQKFTVLAHQGESDHRGIHARLRAIEPCT